MLRISPLSAYLPFLPNMLGIRHAGHSILWSDAWSQ
jgi:hypothetical protein